MKTIPKTTRLTTLEQLLITQLEQSGLSPVPLVINCFLDEVLLILVESPDNHLLNLEKIEAFLYKILKQENLCQAYFVEIYYYVNGQYCFLEAEKKPSFLEILAWELLNKDSRIFLGNQKDVIVNWYQRSLTSLNKKFKSNQLSWLLISGSLGSLTLSMIIYGLTRPCTFDQCSQIQKAQQLSNQINILLENDVNTSKLTITQTQLEEAIELLQKIPFWSDYYQQSSTVKEQYQQQLNNIVLLNRTKNTIDEALSLSQKSSLSLKKLEALKQEYKTALERIALIKNNGFLDEFENNYYQKILKIIQKINDKIAVEKQANKSLQQAQQAAELARKRDNSADQLPDLQLVYNTWLTAIKRIQEIPPHTTPYQSSRVLLKTYLSNKTRAERRTNQEKIALTMYEQAEKYSKMARQSEQNNQWSQAVNYWNIAIVYIKKVPQNTFKWNEVQPLISTYNLSLAQATNKLKQITEAKTITSELDTMCILKPKICDYQITETLIKMKLESDYLERVWMTAIQAKAQGNFQIQVELLNHLSTFEHRLQKISNQTGKSIEVYNSQGNLMTVYHRQQ
ncbi:MAG: hypothetical protein QNJ42_12615 [Crocosphaera sp.]|nr:hypothetical protein [Crocosphaera sp.]